jgi:hypothetical protein
VSHAAIFPVVDGCCGKIEVCCDERPWETFTDDAGNGEDITGTKQRARRLLECKRWRWIQKVEVASHFALSFRFLLPAHIWN